MIRFLKFPFTFVKTLTHVTPILKPTISSISNINYGKPFTNHISNRIFPQKFCLPFVLPDRSIFIYRSGDLLWEGVVGAPGRMKKRARGKRRVIRNRINLNIGRKVGENPFNYKYPGLNAPVSNSIDRSLKRVVGVKDEQYEKQLLDNRNKQNKRKFRRTVPVLKRGWTGNRIGGQSLGKPEAVIGQDYEGYNSTVLEFKTVSCMKASKGRFGRFSVTVIVGNERGLAGIGKTKSTNIRNALKCAKQKATKKFEYFDLFEGRTLWHPDFIKDNCTTVFVKPMPEGYGLVCHRVIKSMCKLIGIKDMHAKVEGSTKNYQVIARAFQTLLRNQESYQEIADRLSLNVIELRRENDDYPRLLASPKSGQTRIPGPDEDLNFDRLHMDGNVFWNKVFKPFYKNLPGPIKNRKLRHRYRNLKAVEKHRNVLNYLADEGHLIREKIVTK